MRKKRNKKLVVVVVVVVYNCYAHLMITISGFSSGHFPTTCSIDQEHGAGSWATGNGRPGPMSVLTAEEKKRKSLSRIMVITREPWQKGSPFQVGRPSHFVRDLVLEVACLVSSDEMEVDGPEEKTFKKKKSKEIGDQKKELKNKRTS